MKRQYEFKSDLFIRVELYKLSIYLSFSNHMLKN